MPSPSAQRRRTASAPKGVEHLGDIETLYRNHAKEVTRWAARLVSPAQALELEDIVHQVFLVAQRRLADFRGDSKLTTWLHGITIRVVQEARRRQRRWWLWPIVRRNGGASAAAAGLDTGGADDYFAALPSEQPSALELLEKKEAGRLVYQILDQLDEKYRTTLILFELEGLTGPEIAAVTGTSLPNVWVRLMRARQQFINRFVEWEASSPREPGKASAER